MGREGVGRPGDQSSLGVPGVVSGGSTVVLGRPVWSDPSTDSSPMSTETLRTPPARVGNAADATFHGGLGGKSKDSPGFPWIYMASMYFHIFMNIHE